MWEGYLNQWLLSYLGHFLEYKQEDLKAHALKGLGIQITGARLKPEALEFLQLPVAVQEGRIGSLFVQCPWGFRGRIVVELSDVYFCATPWKEAQWEEGPAQKRRQAANTAQLGSAEVQKASRSLSGTSTAQKGGFGWSLLSWIGSILLNKLQLSVRQVHVCLKVPNSGEPALASQFGLHLGLLQTGHSNKQTQLKLSQAASAVKGRVLKDISMQELSVYWDVDQSVGTSNSSDLTDSAGQNVAPSYDNDLAAAQALRNSSTANERHVMRSVSGGIESISDPDSARSTEAANAADSSSSTNAVCYILRPMSSDLRVSTKTDKRTGMTKLSTLALVENVQLQLNNQQMCDLVRISDLFAVWDLRNRYAVLRPTGWRSDEHAVVPPRRLWQYAVNAVLQDLGKQQPHKLSSQHLRQWRRQRQRVQANAATAAPVVATASHSAPEEHGSTLGKTGTQKESAKSAEARQGWWAWGLSALGYPSAKEDGSHQHAHDLPSGFTEADMQELRTALSLDSFDSQHGTDAKESARKMEIGADVKVAGISIGLFSRVYEDKADQLACLELEQANTQVSLSPNGATVSGTVQEVMLQDYCTGSRDVSEAILTRWHQTGSGVSARSSEQTPRSSSSNSLSNSFIMVSGSLNSGPPLVQFQYVSRRQLSTESPRPSSPPASDQCSLEVQVQPLNLAYNPVCFSRILGLMSGAPHDTQSARVTKATNLIARQDARTLASAQRALKQSSWPAMSVQIENVALALGQATDHSSDKYVVLKTGTVLLSHKPHTDNQEHHRMVDQLQQHIHNSAQLSQHALQELLTKVQRLVLHQRMELSFASMQLHTTAGHMPLQMSHNGEMSHGSTLIIRPCQCTAYLDVHRIPDDAHAPGMKALVNFDETHILLNPEVISILGKVFDQHGDPAHPQQETASIPVQHPKSGSPMAELNVTAKAASACYYNGHAAGKDSDATNVDLRLRGKKLDLLFEIMDSAVAAKLTVAQLYALDKSKYHTRNPKIYGNHAVPRLAQIMEIDAVTVRFDQSQAEGWMLSSQLLGASAKGWSGETGNFITRLAPNRPAQAEFTVYNTKDRLQTSITLQDGCFGTATLMRIAALFMPTPAPPSPLPPAPGSPAKKAASGLQPDVEARASSSIDFSAAGSADAASSTSAAGKEQAEQTASTHIASQVAAQSHASADEQEQSALPKGDTCRMADVASEAAQQPEVAVAGSAQSSEFTSKEAGATELTDPLLGSPTSDLHAEPQLATHSPHPTVATSPEADPSSDRGSESDAAPPNIVKPGDNGTQTSTPVTQTHPVSATGIPSVALPAQQRGLQDVIGLGASQLQGLSAGQPAATFADVAIGVLDAQSAITTATSTATVQEAATGDAAASAQSTTGQPQGALESNQDCEAVPSEPAQTAEPAQKRCEQFSLEIVRCKSVCPAQVTSTSFTHGDSPLDHTLYLEVPHFLLQLPIEQPAQHPRPHPVNLNVSHVLSGQHQPVPAPDAAAPSPFAVDQQQGTICALTSLALFVALPEEFESVNPAHAHSTLQLPPLLSIPTASLLAVGPRPPPCHPSLQRGLPPEAVPTLELEMKVAEVIAKPAQLQTMSASTIRYTTEMDVILGRTPVVSSAPPLAAAAVTSEEPKSTSTSIPTPGFALEASIGLISIHLHNSNKDRPAVVLHWQRLSGHYAWAAASAQIPQALACSPLACGLSWRYLSLQLAQDPHEQKPQLSLENLTSARSGSLVAPSRLARAHSDPAVAHMGRAASIRSHPSSARHPHARSTHGSVHGSRHGKTSLNLTRAASPEQEHLQHQHSLSRLHVAPVGNTRGMGLNGLNALAAIAADDNESVPESVHCIFNNRARLSSDGFAEALEAVLPSNPSATSLHPGQQQEGSDAASSSDTRSHGRDLHRLMSGGTSVASSHISIGQLQRQVPVIRHRPFFMAFPSDDPAIASYATASSDLDHLSDSMQSSSHTFYGYYDASEKLQSPSRNWSPDVDKLPAGDRLLLLLGSKQTLAPSDANAHPNTAIDASAACTLQPSTSDASPSLALEVCATDMLLRIYLEGWQVLIHSRMECLAAIHAGQQQPNPARNTSANSFSQSTFMTDLGSNASVQLHATELVAELIANTYTSLGHEASLAALPGVSHMSPCISVTTEVNIGSQLHSTGQPRHCLRVPRLAVSAAVLRMSPNVVDLGSRDELGLLLGSQGFEAALIMPVRQTVTSTPGAIDTQQQAESVTTAGLASLDMQLQQLSVFASQRRLCTAAALFTVVQEVQDGLRSMTRQRTSIAAEVAMTKKAKPGQFGSMLKTVHCSLHAHKLAVLLSSDTYNDDTPIMEAAACDMHVESQGQVHSQQPLQDQQQSQQRAGVTWQKMLQGLAQPSAQAQGSRTNIGEQDEQFRCNGTVVLLLNVYNNALMGWEPLLEPWRIAVDSVWRGMQHLSSQQLQLSLATSDIMEVTLTPAVTSCYDAACKLLDNVAAVAADATTLEKSLFAVSEDSNSNVESIYWIQNLTDSSVQFWVQRPGQLSPRFLFQPLDLGDPSDVEPQATEPLFPQEHQQPSCKGCHVGSPQLFVTDPPQPVSSLSSSTGSDTSDACPSSPTYADSCALQQLNTEQEATLATAAASERHITQATGLPDVVSNDALALTEVCEVRTPQETSAAEGTLAGPAAWTPQGAVCHRQAGLKVLIKLHGQGKDSQLLGSWGLDQEQCNSKQVVLSRLTQEGVEMQQKFRVYCEVSRGPRGGAGLTLHSGIKLHNTLEVWLCIGIYQNWPNRSEREEPEITQLVGPAASIWLPALCCSATYFSLQPADEDDRRPSVHQWSQGVPLLQLLHQADFAHPGAHCQNLVCRPVKAGGDQPAHFCLGAHALPAEEGYTLLVKAPIELYNALPLPVHIGLNTSRLRQSSWRVTVQPLQTCLLTQGGAFEDVQTFQLEPIGYAASPTMQIPHADVPTRAEVDAYRVLGRVTVELSKNKKEEGSVSLTVTHCIDPQSGSHALRLSCPLWVYNGTNCPVALMQNSVQEQHFHRADEGTVPEIETQAGRVPTDWIPPYRGPSQRPPPPRSTSGRQLPQSYSPTHSSEASTLNTGSRYNLSGLGGVLTSPSRHSVWAGQQSSIASSPKGMTDSGQVAALYLEGTRYASMQGSAGTHTALQLCVTTAVTSGGRALWSGPVQLNALGAAAVVEVPCPVQPVHQHKQKLPGYRLAVTAVQIPNENGALALHVMPRYVLHNNLKQDLQYKQQGLGMEFNLMANTARTVYWADITQKDLRLCLRLQEAGQQWSGGFPLDTPGDLFVKIRHREHETTRLIRVDVSSSANGVLAVAFTEQERGFAPYRLDNCTSLRLHLRQQGCLEQDDLLRPYSSLDYAWDEPALAHKLVLEQPGGRRLGVYNLDRVGNCPAVLVPATSQRAEQRIQVCVRSDGPRRVLELVDQLVHVQLSSAQQELSKAQLGWEPWSGTLYPTTTSRAAQPSPALAGISLELQLSMGGLGLSLVQEQQEVLYGRVSGIQARAVTGVARQTLELAVEEIQVDNPATDAAYPVAITSPHVWSNFGRVVTAVAAAATAGVPKPAAFCLRWSVWRSRPGSVLCIERLQLQASPLLVEVEQLHIRQLLAFARAVMAPLKQESVVTIRHRLVHEPDLLVTRAGGIQRISTDKVHIEYLHISQLLLTLSFTPSPGGTTGLQRLVSFAGEVEGMSLRLAALEVHHPLLSQPALAQLLQWHYIRAARPQLYKLVGSANVIGAPMSVLHHLGLGVWSFLASPALGIVESTQGGGLNLPRLLGGFVQGCHSLTNSILLAVTTSTAKAASATRRALASLGLDRLQATGLPGRRRSHKGDVQNSSSLSGQAGFLSAALSGCLGVISEPIRGMARGSVSGTLQGLLTGGLGLIVLPLNSLLGTAASLSGSVRDRLLGADISAPRLRPPRYVSSRETLALYSWTHAFGRALLQALEQGRYANEGFITCYQLQSSTAYIMITRVHLLAVSVPYIATSSWAPSLLWAAALGDIELCKVQDGSHAELSVLVMQPVLSLAERQFELMQKTMGLRVPSRSPWQHYAAAFEVRANAEVVARLVIQARDETINNCLLPILRGGFLGSSWWTSACMQLHNAERHVENA